MSYLNKLRNTQSTPSDLFNKLEKSGNNRKKTDFWTPTRDKTGTGQATIRFLPPVEGEDLPIVQLYHHGFKDDETGLWYIENSRTTLGERDPLSEFNQWCWRKAEANNDEDMKKLVSKRKRTLSYISNINAIKDHGDPKNDGLSKPYRYGARIYEKIKEAMEPKFEGIDPIAVFDLWNGADFNLRVSLDSNKIPQYTASTFSNVKPLYNGEDEALERVMETATKLQSFVAPDQFKSYDELDARLVEVIGDLYVEWQGQRKAKAPPRKTVQAAEEPQEESVPWESQVKAPEPKAPKAKPAKKEAAEPKVETVIDSDTTKMFEELEAKIGLI